MWQLARQVSSISGLALAGSLLLGACSSKDGGGKGSSPDPAAAGAAAGEQVSCTNDVRVETFTEGLSKTGSAGISVTLASGDPEPPARGDNSWNVTVLDGEGKPLRDVQLVVSARMPDHGHMSPTTPEASPTDAQGNSTISGLDLFMAGVWLVDLSIMQADSDGLLDNVSFAFCVEG
jgi:hypothetical protein